MNRFAINDFNAVLTLMLFRITLLLATGWLLHACLRNRNPWLSIWSWRMILVGVALVAITGSSLPGWGPVFGEGIRHSSNILTRHTPLAEAISADDGLNKPNTAEVQPQSNSSNTTASLTTPTATLRIRTPTLISWLKSLTIETTLWTTYLLVAGILLLRLCMQALCVRTILRRAEPADEQIERLVEQTARSLGLAKSPQLLISSQVSGPVATGILRPTIVLPAGMTNRFSERDLQFMLAHECSHFAGLDLAWSLAARLGRILLWPHPLIWAVPPAHRFACDLRCDATAAGRETAGYSKMLAGLALSWQPRPVLPLAMAFFGQSETIQRLEFLDSGVCRHRPSRRRQVYAALGMTFVFGLAGTIGMIHSHKGEAFGQTDNDPVMHAVVTIVDAQGKPVEGAVVDAPNLRPVKEPDSHYGNHKNQKTETNQQGTAEILFPKFVFEQMETGQVTLTVNHPDFVSYCHDHRVDEPIKITLDSGRRVRLTAKDTSTGQRITEKLFVLLPDFETIPWKSFDDGTLLSPPLSNDLRLMLVVNLRDGQPTLFSELIDLAKYPSGDCQIDDVGLSRGRRIRGRLSNNVPRPIIKGNVGLTVASSVSNAPTCDNSIIWEDFAVTSSDGTFEFPSVPRNEGFQLVGYCQGWVSESPSIEQIQQFSPGTTADQAQNQRDALVVSQHYAADHVAPIEIKMEPHASCRVTVVDDKGNPIPRVTVAMGSHYSWTPAFTFGIGYYQRTSIMLGRSEEEARRLMDKLHGNDDADTEPRLTDSNGQVLIRRLAGKKNSWIAVDHPNFDLPPGQRNRFHRQATVDLTPGQTTEIKLALERKGAEIIGK